MNDYDKKLMEFFYDFKNIKSFKCNSINLENFYNECVDIIENKKFSDINLQDKLGNTYLHYLCMNSEWNWFIKIIELGGDPTIKNKQDKNAFQSAKSIEGVFNFWRISSVKELSSFYLKNWHNRTKNMSLNYKQFLFESYFKENTYSFSTIKSIQKFLEKANLLNHNNIINLVSISAKINETEKFTWFTKNYFDPTFNTSFLVNLSSSTEHILINKLLTKKLSQTEDLNRFLMKLFSNDINQKEDKHNLIQNSIKMMLVNNFDFYQIPKLYTPTDKTLLDFIQLSPLSNKIFLEETISNKQLNNKKIKV